MDDFEDLFGEFDLTSQLDPPIEETVRDDHHVDEGEDDEVSPPVLLSPEKLSTIAKIEAVFEDIADALLDERSSIGLDLKRRGTTASAADAPVKRVNFPGKTAEEAWRFAVIVRIMELMHEALRSDVVLSKRDIYYRDPALFGGQAHVDRYVDDIAFTFGVSRSSVGVAAVAKGLMTGAVTFCRRDGSLMTANGDRDGILVPSLRDMLSADMSAVRWILVIEKEATFRSIASSSFWTKRASQGVIITAKGYPDIATRAMLHYMSTASPRNGFASPPVFGLMDFDPDGLAILSTYKHGSKALAHESAELCVPSMKWLGLRSEHIMLSSGDTHASQGMITLTARDRRKAQSLLQRQGKCEQDDIEVMEWRSELQRLLMLNVKAEMQLLDAIPNGMTHLLKERLDGLSLL